ncbi:hypothetical protein ELZ88_24395 (plasmid) [Salmonella enterica subsp. enterica serovar Karamoja]|uniref:Phage holin n=1 Tax=Salmonella enterica subsp. enterica serovar Karamoja TaxID=2500153 RepID=A0A3Q9MQJ3_SALET|nr:putative holin [Salmonella enterica]AZT39674.1 hypothetical protein ELZ88_24395 [Salmonella enterica subsp. enterica serovar Karamoja]AZT44426.1 hypothetical protein EL007_24545 [Salmonella enterica subsp. enterica serovar Karamoja]
MAGNVPASLASVITTSMGNPWVVIGAFAGSIIFIVSETEYTHWAKVGLFAASMLIGISSSDFIASLLSHVMLKYLDFRIDVPPSVGATVSAVLSVRILMYIANQHNNEESLLKIISKGLKR